MIETLKSKLRGGRIHRLYRQWRRSDDGPRERHSSATAIGDSNASVAFAASESVSNDGYWTSHNVTQHAKYSSAEESIRDFEWRNAQYYPYLDLMPVAGQDGKVVLDYGCGPGFDLVGFAIHSKTSRLIGADISPSSLAEAKSRVALHGVEPELLLIREQDNNRIPLPDSSVDYVHSSGVIHHAVDPQAVLRELRRVLHPSGSARVMVYNYNSLWVHLYTAYVKMIEEADSRRREGARDPFAGLTIRQAFAKLTDGPNCPYSRAYKPEEFCALAESAGWACRFEGAAVSMWEMGLLHKRFDAVRDSRLAAEHRDFLLALEIDSRGFARIDGHYAGVDGCYRLAPLEAA